MFNGCHIGNETTASARRLYVPAHLDTKKKPFPGQNPARKGIK